MELEPLVAYLEQNHIGTQGQDIFINSMPVECKLGTLLRSPLGGAVINHEIPGYVKSEFSVIVRSHKYETGKALMKSVTDTLTMQDRQLTGIYVRFIRPHHYPVSFRVSDGNFVELMVKFDTVYMVP